MEPPQLIAHPVPGDTGPPLVREGQRSGELPPGLKMLGQNVCAGFEPSFEVFIKLFISQ